VNCYIILKWSFRTCGGFIEWNMPAHDRDSWRAVECTVINCRVP
jgi:hypothetical protein